MEDTLSFDRQMGDLVWSLVTGLRAGYSIRQVIEVLAITAPEPSASAFRQLDADLKAGLSLADGFVNFQEAVPSHHLAQVIAVIQAHRQMGGNLADQLEPLVEGILAEVGSDGAFYPAMRQQSEQLGAQLPPRAALQQDES